MTELSHRKKLAHYRRLLACRPDEAQRNFLLRLLAEEEAKYPPLLTMRDADEFC